MLCTMQAHTHHLLGQGTLGDKHELCLCGARQHASVIAMRNTKLLVTRPNWTV